MHLEWGAEAITRHAADLYVIVDVLSFSTCVDIAVGRGAFVLPFAYKDARAAGYAAEQDALLAGPRDQGGFSLSPASLNTLPAGTRLVLPSPNGATLSLLPQGVPTLCACLRNAAAVAAWIEAGPWQRVQLVAAGERWPEGTLRPALEDLLGAGAVLAGLSGRLSAEAEAAVLLYRHHSTRLQDWLWNCDSGQELRERGFAADVSCAAAVNVSSCVPRLNTQTQAYIQAVYV
ncbi:MAG: 2-phosphosulfolactate phosphatase [Candidatus Sericytochromatia bacterium]